MFLNKVKGNVDFNTFKKYRIKYSFDPKTFFSKLNLPSNSFTILESETILLN